MFEILINYPESCQISIYTYNTHSHTNARTHTHKHNCPPNTCTHTYTHTHNNRNFGLTRIHKQAYIHRIVYLTCFVGGHHLQTGREGWREGGRDGGRERRREMWREGEKEGERKRGRESARREGEKVEERKEWREGEREHWRGMLMSSKEHQVVILAETAREEMTEGRHNGRLGVCPRISKTRSMDTDMEVI